MSYSLIGHFFDIQNKKRLFSANLSILKSLNNTRYSAVFDDITPTGGSKANEFSDFFLDYEMSFINYVSKDFLTDENVNKEFLVPYTRTLFKHTQDQYLITNEKEYNRLEETIKKYAFYGVPNDDNDLIILFVKKEYHRDKSECWYTAEDFRKVLPDAKRSFEEKRKRLEKLESLKDTPQWFELSDRAKENAIDEISYSEEEYESSKEYLDALEYIITIFDFIEEMCIVERDEYSEIHYVWPHEDNRKIELCIEVC